MADLLVRADRVVLPAGERPAALLVRDGVITAIGGRDTLFEPAGPAAAVTIEVGPDRVVMPGLVDSHVHVNEPGRTAWEGFATATAAAAAGGVTTVVDMPLNSIPPTTTPDGLHAKQRAAQGKLAVDVAFWGGAVPGNLSELRALHEAGVVGFKCFLLPSGVAEFGHLDGDGLRAAMTEIAGFGGLLIAHAEDPSIIDRAPQPAGRSYAGFVASRPAAAENSAIRDLIRAMADTGCRAHIVHLSSASALDEIAAARAQELPLTVETCPHYLTLSAEQIPDGATQFKCCPPIRDSGNQDALWQGLAQGLIDQIVSDHSPSTPELKNLDTGDFGTAWGGISSVQLGLPAIWTAAAARGYGLPDLARWMAAAPARLTGLSAKGSLTVGADADFSLFAPEESFVVDPRRLRHRNPVTPYAGTRLTGVVTDTFLRGRRVDPARPHGMMLRRTGRPA